MRYAGAIWRGSPNENPGAMIGHIGLVLHIEQGTEAGTDSWFANPASQVSAHFGNPKTGRLEQFVDTDDRAWAQVSGNPWWVSCENEGNSGDALTPSQLENAAELLAWLHSLYNVPLQVSDTPLSGTAGLTGHGLGGAAWGGHTNCPGAPILAARQAIITRAAQIAGAPTPGDSDMNLSDLLGPISPGMAALVPDDASEQMGAGATYTVGAALMGTAERAAETLILTKQIRADIATLTTAVQSLTTTIATLTAHLTGSS